MVRVGLRWDGRASDRLGKASVGAIKASDRAGRAYDRVERSGKWLGASQIR